MHPNAISSDGLPPERLVVRLCAFGILFAPPFNLCFLFSLPQPLQFDHIECSTIFTMTISFNNFISSCWMDPDIWTPSYLSQKSFYFLSQTSFYFFDVEEEKMHTNIVRIRRMSNNSRPCPFHSLFNSMRAQTRTSLRINTGEASIFSHPAYSGHT